MTTVLSICIPTLNRPEYFCVALNSILSANIEWSLIEICISNNASDVSYSAAQKIINSAPNGIEIKYIEQKQRLSIDEHMMFVKNMANSPYIYFLGDDDYFLEGQLPLLVNFIKEESPDLAIFNGMLVDGNDNVLGSHFDLPEKIYLDIEEAFLNLRDKGMFGSVLVKCKHLNDENFIRLFGTAHGYGCYWFSLLSIDSLEKPPVVIIPRFPLVALRMANKNYNLLDVYLRDIPYEIAIYQRYLGPGLPQRLNEKFKKKYFRKISSVQFLVQMLYSVDDAWKIKNINPEFYARKRLNIWLSIFLVRSGVFKVAKSVYRLIKTRMA